MKFFKFNPIKGIVSAIALAAVFLITASANKKDPCYKKDPVKQSTAAQTTGKKDPLKIYAGIDPVKQTAVAKSITNGGSVHGTAMGRQGDLAEKGNCCGSSCCNEGKYCASMHSRQGDYAEKTSSGNYTNKGAGSHGTGGGLAEKSNVVTQRGTGSSGGGGYAEKSNRTIHSDMALLNGPPTIAKTNE